MLRPYIYTQLSISDIQLLCKRNNANTDNDIYKTVVEIIKKVQQEGDNALLKYAQLFDSINLSKLFIEKEQLQELAISVNAAERAAITVAYQNIKKFHQTQLQQETPTETMLGVQCWRENRAIEKVGLYIPGGTAVLPSTFLMLAIPAQLAGCKEIIVCSPPQKTGLVNAYIAFCATLLGIDKIYLVGGAQAIAAMAFGTESIPKVDKIFGPGNRYVTYAKQFVQANSNTAIDMPAGPSEVLIIADETANAKLVAADLLAQAEHGLDSQCILVSHVASLLDQVNEELKQQIEHLPRKLIAKQALENSYAVITANQQQSLAFSNEYAPEHLIVAMNQWQEMIPKISNAGSVFLGHLTPESAGDYASGTNHTLPTSGYAKSYSGVSLDSFLKKITFQHINKQGVGSIASTVEILASIEGLDAHKNAMSFRKNMDM